MPKKKKTHAEIVANLQTSINALYELRRKNEPFQTESEAWYYLAHECIHEGEDASREGR